MKSVQEVMSEIKGKGNESEIITGKNPFNRNSFSDLVHALLNDTTYKIPQFDPKTGEKTGEINVSELIRSDLKKTLENANYPQKSEAGVLDTVEIATDGLTKTFGDILMQQLSTGKGFRLPPQQDMVGSLSIAEVPANERTLPIRDPKTQQDLGTADVKTEAYKQLRVSSPAPDHKKTITKHPPKN